LKGFLEEIKNRINLNIFYDCLNSIKDLKSLEEQKKNNFQEIFKIVFNTYNEYNEESIEKKIIEYNLNKLLFNFLPSMTAKRVESFFNQIDCYSTTSTKDQLNNSICFEFDNLVEELASRKELDKKVRCILLADNSKHGIYLACEALSKLPNKQEKDDLINLMKIFAFDESLIQKQDEIKEPSTKNELSDLQGLDDLKISK
jgi:hypothetical protein